MPVLCVPRVFLFGYFTDFAFWIDALHYLRNAFFSLAAPWVGELYVNYKNKIILKL